MDKKDITAMNFIDLSKKTVWIYLTVFPRN